MRKPLALATVALMLLLFGFIQQEQDSRGGRKQEPQTQVAGEMLGLTRGPYLQVGTSTQITVRWRTDLATNSRVQYGLAANDLSSSVEHLTVATEHEVTLPNLTLDTKYYYAVGSSTSTLASGSDYSFVTAPIVGSAKKTRVWVLGDAGTANSSQQAVRDAYYNFTGATPTDLWVMLGDNAYDDGTDLEYQAAVFDIYPTMLRQSVLWPAFGNHDGHSASSLPPTGVFYDIFTLPGQGEAGGVPSGTEAYYSFEYGNIHFISLNSEDISRATTGAMLTWLQQDLAANTKPWTIAFWHHPPYSKGSHNSDTESQLIEMRQNALPLLENGGVDLVLTGHSHSYERSFLLDGHYGASGTLTNDMKRNFESGSVNTGGAYTKPLPGAASHQGAVYVVAGSSGKTSGGSLNHPAMFFSLNALGSLVLDVDGNRLDAAFLDNLGNTRDNFAIIKGASPFRPSNLSATALGGNQIDLAWTDNASDEEGFKIYRTTGATSVYSEVATVSADLTTYSDPGLPGGVTYYYRVRAYHAGGLSSYSNEVSATTSTAPPATPSSLAATAVSSGQINLTWIDNANNESGFKLERKLGAGGTYAEIASVGANLASYSNTGLAASTTYYFRVRAYNAGGNSAYSNEANATTFSNANLALNKPATAASTNGSNVASRAVDASTSTYWRSGSVSSSTIVWLQVDLQTAQNIGRVVIKWRGSYYAKQYQVRVSSNASTWTTVYSDNVGNGGTDDFTFTAVSARYVQIYMTKNNKSSERVDEFEAYSGASGATELASLAREPSTAPDEITLRQNYPNPFNPSTTIFYTLSAAAEATLRVLNLNGQEVAKLARGYHEAGAYRVRFDGTRLPNGIYFAVLRAGASTRVQRMVLVK